MRMGMRMQAPLNGASLPVSFQYRPLIKMALKRLLELDSVMITMMIIIIAMAIMIIIIIQ